jgi:hypothetical protein
MGNLSDYIAKSGRLIPVWTLEIQVRPDDVDRILDVVMEIYPLPYGRYQRNASASAVGMETTQPEAGSTTTTHVEGFEAGQTEDYPMVELKVSVPRELALLQSIMDAVIYAHQYEEPVIYVREDWASRSAYDPTSDNPNRWWNDGRGLPARL